MRWSVRRRRAGWIAAVAIASLALSHHRLLAQRPAVPIDLELDSRHADLRGTVLNAAEDAVARYTEWLGPPPFDRVVIGDRAMERAAAARAATIVVDIPWQPRSLDVEAPIARDIAVAWSPGLQPDGPLARGLASYLQSRIVERLFNVRAGVHAYRSERLPLFGGLFHWSLAALRLSRSTAGLRREMFLRNPGEASRAIPVALAFGTLERWLGWPVLQGALRALSQEAQHRTLSDGDAVGVLSSAAGLDLAWLFDQVLDPAKRFDYSLDSVTVAPSTDACAAPSCFVTEVVVTRSGNAVFTGTSRQPADDFQAGDGLEVRIGFENGQTATARWDGRAARHELRFESAARPGRVWLDPDRVLLLDTNLLDSTRATSPGTNVPLGKWIARWLVWLQDAALACTAVM
jgi:hypothetical protein